MYQISIKRDGNNPLTGRAQYRVVDCFRTFDGDTFRSKRHIKTKAYHHRKTLALLLEVPKKRGTIINPRKELFGEKR